MIDEARDGVFEGENKAATSAIGVWQRVPHRGLRAGALQHLVEGIIYGVGLMYIGEKMVYAPLTDQTPTKYERNREIRMRYARGESLSRLGDVFGLSPQRVSQIVQCRQQ